MAITYDRSFVDSALERMAKIPDDTQPLWGSMSPGQMRAHLQTAVRYSLGKEEETPDESKPLLNMIIIPLLLSGIMKMPKGLPKPGMYNSAAPSASVQEVKVEMEEFLEKYEGSGFNPPPHPSLGALGPKKWAQLHNIHFDHHLRQFGA